MFVIKDQMVEAEVVEDIICDSCNKSCKKNTDYEYCNLTCNWGYYSHRDMECRELHFCGKCYEELIFQLKVPEAAGYQK